MMDQDLFYGPHICTTECDGSEGCMDGRKEIGRYDRVELAKRICKQCPVQEDCLNYALVNDERYGIWGGMSERERRTLRVKMIREGEL